MHLSLHTDYGLRTLMYLSGIRQRATVGQIAEFYEISKDHLSKVVQRLTGLGWVRTVRGIGGGLELATQPECITVGEVIEKLEGSTQLLECVTAQTQVCVIQPNCKLRRVLAEAQRIQMEYLRSIKLSEIAKPGVQLVNLSKP
ncbi:MAG: Rrf2 family transcriptional regulator [Pirellulaceae bacterium]|nr:Rrf2 family transcriptional regulator [Pirellulaceae bacterium]